MKRRLLVVSAIALALGCEGHQTPTGPSAPLDPSQMISDGAHGGNPDFFFLPPMVSNPGNNPNFEQGKFNATLGPSLTVEICQLQGSPVDAQGLPIATDCVAGAPVEKFPAGTIKLQQADPDGFYMVVWNTQQSNLDVTKYYRIKVLIAGSTFPFGAVDIDPVSNMREFKNARTGEIIPLNAGSTLPIKFRIEKGGGPTLCGSGSSLCASATVTNHTPNGGPQVVQVQGNNGPIAGVVLPDGWLPPGGPQTVVVTISSVNTGANDVTAGTQENPCHAGLPLEQFNGCFKFTTTPTLAGLAEGGHQFARAVTVVTCYVLHDTGDPREKYSQLWSSGPNEPAHPLASVSDALVLTAPNEHACGTNFNAVIGSNAPSNLSPRVAEELRSLRRSVTRFLGVRTAYAVDLGLGGLTLDFSNVSPVLTARVQAYTATDTTLSSGATAKVTARIVGTQVHNGGPLATGIGGMQVTFRLASGNGALQFPGIETPLDTVTVITSTNPIDGSPTSGGGFSSVNWTVPTTPGSYTLTAVARALGGPITFTATVLPNGGINLVQGSLTAGAYSTCGLTTGASAYCWGYGGEGSLGTGTTLFGTTTPVAVAGGLALASLAGGDSYMCGLTTAGAAYCWGRNDGGQIGDGTHTNRNAPVAVTGGITFRSLTAGFNNTCGLRLDGAAFCWGVNSFSELGTGSPGGDQTAPVAVVGGHTFVSLAVGGNGDHNCGLTSAGLAYCWGQNNNGQVGDGTTADRSTPVLAAAGRSFTSLTAGDFSTCGLTAAGTAYCWGDNLNGQLGDGSTTSRNTAAPVIGGQIFASLSGGAFHTCGLTGAGAAYCWGSNYSGQLGDGTLTDRSSPVPVLGGITFTSLTAGEVHTCGLTSSGAAYCWGDNNFGAVGDGTFTSRSSPVLVVSP